MTVLVAPTGLHPDRSNERWHAHTLHGGTIASVVVASSASGHGWFARTTLRDRGLRPIGGGWTGGPYPSPEAAHEAGRLAALRLHKALVGLREVVQPSRAVLDGEPAEGYRSHALRRYVQAQQHAPDVIERGVVEAVAVADAPAELASLVGE